MNARQTAVPAEIDRASREALDKLLSLLPSMGPRLYPTRGEMWPVFPAPIANLKAAGATPSERVAYGLGVALHDAQPVLFKVCIDVNKHGRRGLFLVEKGGDLEGALQKMGLSRLIST